jgi:hypothetical protein
MHGGPRAHQAQAGGAGTRGRRSIKLSASTRGSHSPTGGDQGRLPRWATARLVVCLIAPHCVAGCTATQSGCPPLPRPRCGHRPAQHVGRGKHRDPHTGMARPRAAWPASGSALHCKCPGHAQTVLRVRAGSARQRRDPADPSARKSAPARRAAPPSGLAHAPSPPPLRPPRGRGPRCGAHGDTTRQARAQPPLLN